MFRHWLYWVNLSQVILNAKLLVILSLAENTHSSNFRTTSFPEKLVGQALLTKPNLFGKRMSLSIQIHASSFSFKLIIVPITSPVWSTDQLFKSCLQNDLLMSQQTQQYACTEFIFKVLERLFGKFWKIHS